MLHLLKKIKTERGEYLLQVGVVIRLQVKAGPKAVNNHLKPNVCHLIHNITEHRGVLGDHVEEDGVFLRVRGQQTHLAFQSHVESLLVRCSDHELMYLE